MGPSRATRPGGVPERLVLAVVMVGTFVAPLDSSIVNIALPEVARDLAASLTAVSWVATAYLLTNASLVLTMGRLGDIWGLRRVYMAGFAVFGLGSLACAFAGSLPLLVAARVAQAVGASMFFAVGPAIVARTFPPQRRGWALGMVALAVSAGLTIGPPLGGLLVGLRLPGALAGLSGWPSIFLVNVPLTVLTVALAWRSLPEDRPQPEPFDLAGAALAGTSLLALLLALSESGAAAGGRAAPLLLGAAAVVLAVGFVAWERRTAHPMLDLTLFRSRTFSTGALAAVLSYLALFSVTFLMPFYLLRVQGLDPRVAGLLLVATPLAMALVAPWSGRLSDRLGARGPSTAGLLLVAAALLGLSALGRTTALPFVAAALFASGSGVSLFQSPNTSAILGATPPSRLGVGSAVVGESRNVGMVLGIAVTAAITAGGLHDPGLLGRSSAFTAAEAADFLGAMRPALWVAAAVALAGAAVSWGRPGKVERTDAV